MGVHFSPNNIKSTSKIDVYCPPINEQNPNFFSVFSSNSNSTRQIEIKSKDFETTKDNNKKKDKKIPWVE